MLAGRCFRLGFFSVIVVQAFGFSTSNHALAPQLSMRFGDDGILAFLTMVVIKVNHHPVLRALELMRAFGVRI